MLEKNSNDFKITISLECNPVVEALRFICQSFILRNIIIPSRCIEYI